MNKRVEFIDIAKFISITCVIFGHKTSCLYALVWPFHLPLFFFVAGYFLSEKGNSIDYLKKRARSLLIPYFFTCGVVCILSIPLAILKQTSIKTDVIHWTVASLYGLGHDIILDDGVTIPLIGAIWFLWAMFFSLLITRWIITITKNKFIQIIAVAILPVVSIITSSYFWLPLSIQSACFAIPFVYIGYIFKINSDDILMFYNNNKVFVATGCIAIGIWGYFNYKDFSMNLCIMGNGVIDIVVAMADTVVIMLISLMLSKINLLKKIMTYFGRMTVVMLSIHLIELNLFPWHALMSKFLSNDKLITLSIALSSYVFILLATYLISKIAPLRSIYSIKN